MCVCVQRKRREGRENERQVIMKGKDAHHSNCENSRMLCGLDFVLGVHLFLLWLVCARVCVEEWRGRMETVVKARMTSPSLR